MADRQDLPTGVLDDVLELTPVDLPGRSMAPTVEERLAAVESVLNIR